MYHNSFPTPQRYGKSRAIIIGAVEAAANGERVEILSTDRTRSLEGFSQANEIVALYHKGVKLGDICPRLRRIRFPGGGSVLFVLTEDARDRHKHREQFSKCSHNSRKIRAQCSICDGLDSALGL